MSGDRRAGEDFVDSVDEIQKRLPERWQLATLGNVIRGFETGRNFQAAGVPAKAGETGVLKISAVTWGRFDPSANKALLPGSEPLPHERIKAGDLLISRANTTELVGAPVLVEQDYPNLMLPDKILRVLYDPELVDPRFLLQALRSKEARSHIEENATGSSDSMRNLSQPKLREIPIPVPPLPEQKRIADKLDRLLARVDACRERLDRVPALLKRFRQSVLAAATSGELTREWRLEKGLSSDPNWPSRRLSEIGELARGKSRHRPRNDPSLYGGPYPFIQTGDVAQSGGLIDSHSQTYSNIGLAQSRLWPKDTVCITIAANIADTAILSYPACFPDSVVGFISDTTKVLPQFAKWSVDVISEQLESFAPATAQKNINLAILNEVTISCPPIEEQGEIVRRIESLFAQADELMSSYNGVVNKVNQITPATLAKAFRGELVPQDPTDEPAAALLARIQETNQHRTRKPG